MRSFPVLSGIAVSVLLWFALAAVDFASIFRYFFIGIVWVAVFLFILLNAEPMKLGPNPKKNLAIAGGLILAFSAITIVGGLYIPSSGKYLLPPDEVKYMDKTSVEVGQIVYLENCVYCHKAEGFTEKVGPGPELSEIGELRDKATIKAKVLNPGSYPSPGYEAEWKERLMPGYYQTRLTDSEIDALALFLSLTPASLPEGGHGGEMEGMEGMEMGGEEGHAEEKPHAEEKGHEEEAGQEEEHAIEGDESFDLEVHLAQKKELYVEEHHIIIKHGMMTAEEEETKVTEAAPSVAVSPEFKLAVEVITTQACGACHTLKAQGLDLAGTVGPDLTEAGTLGRTDEWQLKHLKDPKSVPKEDLQPEYRDKYGLMSGYAHLSDEELKAVVAFLKSLGKEEK